MDALWPVLIVAVIAPVIMALITHMFRRSDRREDWARQDEVAKRVAAVADEVKSANATFGKTLEKIESQTDGNLSRVQLKLDQAIDEIEGLKRLVSQAQAGTGIAS